MSKYSFTKEVKLEILKFYQEESYSLSNVGKIFNVHPDTINIGKMIINFGEDGLERLCKLSSLIGEKFTIPVQESRPIVEERLSLQGYDQQYSQTSVWGRFLI